MPWTIGPSIIPESVVFFKERFFRGCPSRCWFPGGSLGVFNLYLAPEENEEVVSWLRKTFDLELETIEKINGMAEGIDYPETARVSSSSLKERTICC